MATESVQSRPAWALARGQHWLITHAQLLDLGFGEAGIRHRLHTGRLHRLWPGVYAVGRQEVSREGLWLAAVLTCGEGACLSHESSGQLWRLRPWRPGPIDVSVPARRRPRRKGIGVHRRDLGDHHIVRERGIPTTTPSSPSSTSRPGWTPPSWRRRSATPTSTA